MHANALGRLIRSRSVIVPPTPGVMSAFGFLTSDIQNEFPETYLRTAEETPATELKTTVEGLIAQADDWLDGEGVGEEDKRFDLYGLSLPPAEHPDSLPLRARRAYGRGQLLLRGRFEEPTANGTISSCRIRLWRSPPSGSSGAAP